MRLVFFPFVSLLAVYAATPACSAILPLAEAQQVRDPQSPVAETDVDKTTYDEQGRPVASTRNASSLPRRSLEENLKIRLRRGYTVSFEPGELIAIEQFPLVRRMRDRMAALALGDIAYGSLSAGDANLMSRVQPLASSFQPLWVVVVPSSVVDPTTGQMVTVLVGVLGPSVGQNGFLSAIAGNTVLADTLAPTPTLSPTPAVPATITHSIQFSTLQRSNSFVALPNQDNDGDETSATPLDASDDAKPYNRGPANTEINAAVPEPSTWAMMLIGFAGLAAAPRLRKVRFAYAVGVSR